MRGRLTPAVPLSCPAEAPSEQRFPHLVYTSSRHGPPRSGGWASSRSRAVRSTTLGVWCAIIEKLAVILSNLQPMLRILLSTVGCPAARPLVQISILTEMPRFALDPASTRLFESVC